MKSATRVLIGAAVAALFTVAVGAQSSAIPRTPWGDPDIQGTYTNSNESGIPMERPKELAGRRLEDVKPEELATLVKQRSARAEETAETIGGTQEENTGAGPKHWYENYNASNSRAWMIQDAPDYKMPATTDAAKQRAAALRAARRGGDGYFTGPFDSPKDLSLYVRCISRGVPGSMMPAIYGNSYEIVQAPGLVAIRYEMVHETRVIPLDSRKPLPDQMQSYMGDSRGHWEGDTLVIETINFNGKVGITRNGNTLLTSADLKLTERLTRVDADTLIYEATVDDPRTWTRPWKISLPLTQHPEYQFFEYACHEGNYAMRNILSAERAAEKAAPASGTTSQP
jgi:hypothetical protein